MLQGKPAGQQTLRYKGVGVWLSLPVWLALAVIANFLP